MAKQTKQKVKLFTLIIFVSFLISCANQLPPGGGEVDKIPPEIIATYPENETTNYKENYIEFEFSEYVDKRSFKDAIFVSPAIDAQLEIDWTGTSVQITFPNGLKDSVTYVVTIGTDVVDVNNKNRMANAYTFSFATGNQIDKRSVSGKVYGKDIEGTLIFAYKYSDDTTHYLQKKPDYISQIGKDGSYKLSGLAESVYRIFAVKDELRDYQYQSEQDLIGMPFENVSLLGTDSSYTGLNFYLTKIDTMSPRLISTIMTDKNHILVTLSEICDSSVYKANNFFIYDSTSNKKLNVDFAFNGNTKSEEMVLVQTNELSDSNRYYLFANKLLDLNGNSFENDWRELIVSDKPDTSAPKLFKKVPDNNSKIDFKNPEFTFYFDDAIKNKDIKNAIKFEDTLKVPVAFETIFKDDATLVVKPNKDLTPDKDFLITMDLSKFEDASGNKVDSIFTLKFSTISGIEFTGISGRINSSLENIVLVLQNIKDANTFYITKPDNTSSYKFTRVEPGTYSLWFYSDKDSSSTFDYGYPDPFRYSEDFIFYQDSIKLKPRWSVTDFNITGK